LPIVTAFPGWIYGNASWFRRRVIEPVMSGRRVLHFGSTGPWVSPIHVEDCARGLVHLAERGEVGGRYFIVNSDPIRLHDFATTFARLADRTLRHWSFPEATARILAGEIGALRPLRFSPPRAAAKGTAGTADIYRDRRKLAIHPADLAEFQGRLEDAFDLLAERYYLHLRSVPKVTINGDELRVKFDVEKDD
jgi:nucleoside-diphosphate-sugar epimerase